MNILICDDDKLNIRLNRVMVEDFFEKRQVRNIKIMEKKKIDLKEDARIFHHVDIAILDINLHDELNGLDIAKEIRKQNPYVALIFITSYDNYALDAWKIHSLGFLQKPVKEEDFKQVFQKVVLQLNGLRITKMNRMVTLCNKVTLKERDIICVEKISGTKDVKVTTSKETYEFRATIKGIEKLLCDSFVRVNRITLINVHYVFKIENRVVELSNGKAFPISYRKENQIKMKGVIAKE